MIRVPCLQVAPAVYLGGAAAAATVVIVLAAVLTLPESVTCRDSETSYFVKKVDPPNITTIVPALACGFHSQRVFHVNGTGFLEYGGTPPKLEVGFVPHVFEMAEYPLDLGNVSSSRVSVPGSDLGLRGQDASNHQHFAFRLNQTSFTERGRKWWLPNITLTIPSPTESDCSDRADGLLVLVPPAKVDTVSPAAICEGDVQTVTIVGEFFLAVEGQPPRVELRRVRDPWNASTLAVNYNDTADLIVPVTVEASGCEELPRPTAVGVVAESCNVLTITLDVRRKDRHLLGQYTVHVLSAPPASCWEETVGTIDVVPQAEVAVTAPTAFCDGAEHRMHVTGQHFIKANGTPPVVSLGLVAHTWGNHTPPQSAPDWGPPMLLAANATNKAARGLQDEVDNITHVVHVKVLSMSNCTSISTFGYPVETCTGMHVEFSTVGQLSAQYKLFVINLPLVGCCDCIQRVTTNVDIVPRAEVAATAPTAVCQGASHEMQVTGRFFIKSDGVAPTVTLGYVADTWRTFLQPSDMPSPAAVSKAGRGIQNETANVSHAIAAVVESMSGCRNVTTSHVTMEVCSMMQIRFNATDQFAAQYKLYVVNMPIEACCDCLQRVSTTLDIVPRAEVVATAPTAVCQGASHEMQITGRLFIKSDGVVPTVTLGYVADTWRTFLQPSDMPSPAAVSKAGRGIQNETANVSHAIAAVVESMSGCRNVTTSHVTMEVCSMMQIRFNATDQFAAQYKLYVVNMPIEACCDCLQRVSTTLDIVPRVEIDRVGPTAVCEGGARNVAINGRFFMTTNGEPPLMPLANVSSNWSSNTMNTIQTTVTPFDCEPVQMSHLVSTVCTRVDLAFSTKAVGLGLYRVTARNLPVNKCCGCIEHTAGSIDVVPRADLRNVFPPAVCSDANHEVRITGFNFVATNGEPPTVALRPARANWLPKSGQATPPAAKEAWMTSKPDDTYTLDPSDVRALECTKVKVWVPCSTTALYHAHCSQKKHFGWCAACCPTCAASKEVHVSVSSLLFVCEAGMLTAHACGYAQRRPTDSISSVASS